MHLRQPYRHRTHATRGISQTRLFRHTRNMLIGVTPYIFGSRDARRNEGCSRSDDEGLVRTDQCIAHRFYGAFVDLSVLRELREIMDEGAMDRAVALLRAALEAVEIFE